MLKITSLVLYNISVMFLIIRRRKIMALDIDEIRVNYNKGVYTYKVDIPKKVKPDHVFDEELSVKRNRELAQEHNDNVDQMQRDKNRKQIELDRQLRSDVAKYIMDNYGLTEKQAYRVESFTYQEKHSFMSDYFDYIDTFADFASMLTEED
jgi:hypothetical protein